MMLLRGHTAGTGNLVSTLAIQTAAVRPEAPDAWALRVDAQSNPVLSLTGGGTVDGCTGVIDISALTAGKMWMRLGTAQKLTAAGAPAAADITLAVSTMTCGGVVATYAGQLYAPVATGGVQILTGWLLALGIEKFKYGLLVNSVTGDFQVQLVYRIATSLQDVPGAWTTIGAAHGAGEPTPVEVSISIASAMYVQFGLQYSLSSTTPGGGFVMITLATRRG